MAIKERLSERELALADILEDPVWLPELMRSTRDLSPNKESWPKEPFAYRWYQRDLLTDRSPKIVLRGGRAIGKCQPDTARILTSKGFQTIREIRLAPVKKRIIQRAESFIAYAFTEDGKLVQSRAVIQKDKRTAVYELLLKNGQKTRATKDHPFLTPKGYATLELLKAGDSVAALTSLPHELYVNNACRWHELRYFGYMCLMPTWLPERPIPYKSKAVKLDLHKIADISDHYGMEDGNMFFVRRKKHNVPHFFSTFLDDLNENALRMSLQPTRDDDRATIRRIPAAIMAERNENIQVFLEAMFAQWAEITRNKITLFGYTYKFCDNIRELLLRFGIESRVDKDTLYIEHPTALYRIFTQFDIPGISVENIQKPPATFDPSPFYRFEEIESITKINDFLPTFSVYVYDHHTYITDGGMIVHNSLVMEDKIIYETLNHKTVFPDTKELLLSTANQAQMEPLLGRLISRFTSSHLLKDFLQNRINRSLGVMEFRFGDIQHLIRSRIAGKDDANLVGLHLPRIAIDEAQLFSIKSWTQLAPALNSWESNTQLFFAGVKW